VSAALVGRLVLGSRLKASDVRGKNRGENEGTQSWPGAGGERKTGAGETLLERLVCLCVIRARKKASEKERKKGTIASTRRRKERAKSAQDQSKEKRRSPRILSEQKKGNRR